MKIKQKSLFYVLALFMFYNVQGQLSGGGEANPDLATNMEALQAFQELRFGMFIHWGPVSLRGTEIGWSRGVQVPIADYDGLYQEFDPVLFNAKEWVKTARDAGMKYIVLTTKHHDGFSLWDSKYTDYDMMSTPYNRDIVKELAEECKKQGIVFGAYYSIADWHHPDNPMVYPEEKSNTGKNDITDPKTKAQMDRYITYMKNQLKELVDNYDPAFIWFDGEWEWVWTHEMGMDLYKYVRGLKGDILINNRVDKGRRGMEGITVSKKYAGDFATPEQQVGKFDHENAWETCMTIADQWAWKPNDTMKSKKECIQTLLRTVGGDGNLLFNVGPMMDGRIEQRQIDRLKEMGEWLEINGAAVYGTRGGPYLPTDNMVSTRKDNTIFLHLFEKPENQLTLPLAKGIKIRKAYLLKNGEPLQISRDRSSVTIKLPETMPDGDATVIAMELNRSALDIELIP